MTGANARCLQALQSTIYDVRKWHEADQVTLSAKRQRMTQSRQVLPSPTCAEQIARVPRHLAN